MRIFNKILTLILLFSSQVIVASEVDDLMEILHTTQGDPASLDKALISGKQWSSLCQYCHGKEGISKKLGIPHLAGQNPRYLITQFEHFANGSRKDIAMQQIAPELRAEDRVNVALYYSSLPLARNISKAPGLMTKGKTLYSSMCAVCHGEQGKGIEDIPSLARQSEAYLKKTLARFKNKDLRRANSPMIAVAEQLKEQDIEALSAYITAM